MTTDSPRTLEGSILADAILISAGSTGRSAAARTLDALASGGRAFRVDGDLLVVFAEPRRLRCERADGTLLAHRGSVLASFGGAESDCASAPSGSLLLLRYGEILVVPPSRWTAIEARDLLVASPIVVHTLPSLGEPPPPPAIVVRDAKASLRDVFAIGASNEQRAFVADLRDVRADAKRRAESILDAAKRWWSRPRKLLEWLGRFGRSGARRAVSAAPKQHASRKATSTALATPSLWDRALDWLSQKLVYLERLTGRQARYLEDLLDKLDKGEFDDALRHAIPLGGGSGGDSPARIALGVPTPRAELTIHAETTGPASTIPLGADTQQTLRDGYERAFQALDRQGRHEEAAFVLAELLRANERAVEYLVKHGRLALAAEVAESRGLEPARIVELWFRAGDRSRAIAVARRTGSFLPAITRLERASDPLAAVLRLEYADLLASAGDVLRAAEIAWPVPDARGLCREWLEVGMRAGGLAGARCWARFLTLPDVDADDVRTRLLPELSVRNTDGMDFRAAFATHALTEPLGPLGFLALSRTYRGLLRDRTEFGRDLDRLVRDVEAKVGDPVLVADAPKLSALPRAVRSPEPLRLGALDVGTFPVLDAIRLPNGRTLVALGDHGARILGRDGRTETSFDLPAHGLVLDERGERAVIVGRTASSRSLGRLDLTTRRLTRWIDTDAYVVAGTFDGECLYVARSNGRESTLVCLDVLADTPTALFTIGELDYVFDLRVNARDLDVVTLDAKGYETFTFSLPSRVLRSRRRTDSPPFASGSGNAAYGGGLATPIRRTLGFHPATDRELLSATTSTTTTVGEWSYAEGAWSRVVLELDPATCVSLRAHGRFVTAADEQGRVIALDRESLAVESVFFVR